jgi:hypothetical protein
VFEDAVDRLGLGAERDCVHFFAAEGTRQGIHFEMRLSDSAQLPSASHSKTMSNDPAPVQNI